MSKYGGTKKTFKSFSPIRCQHTTVEEWLEHLDLTTYKRQFVKYKTLEDVIKLNDSTLKRLGIKSGADRARMMSSIAILRDAQKNSKGFTGSPERKLRLERLKQEACIPRSIYKLMFHSNTALAGPLGIVPSLNLPSTLDLEYVSWYHGVISRLEAESLVMNEGDFLVRNSSSHPGELVLTCCRLSIPLHFVINCLEYHKDGETSEKFYKFDGETFPSVTGLIKFHWDSGEPITIASGAILRNPVPSQRVVTKEVSSVANKIVVNKILSKEKWTGSQPLLSLDETPFRGQSCSSLSGTLERYGSMPSMLRSNNNLSTNAGRSCPGSQTSTEKINQNQPPLFSIKKLLNPKSDMEPVLHYTNASASKDGGDLYLEPSKIEEHLPPPPSFLLTSPSSPPPSQTKPPPPPKPSRVPTLKFNEASNRPVVNVRNPALYEGEEDDDDNDGDELKNSEDKSVTDSSKTATELSLSKFPLSSYFHHLATHRSSFLPPNNKPLDSTATTNIKSTLLETHPAVIAIHLTYVDITIFNIVSVKDLSLGVASGLELLTLPQGQTLRQDVIERHHSLRLFVCVTILNGSNQGERCNLVSHWLNVAMELKVTTGNIFSFYSIMEALCSSQIVRLKNTWKNLKQLHGSSFEMFETKLLPNYRNLLDASGVTLPYQKNTITPHIYPLLELLERPSMVSEDSSIWKLSSWEMNQPFFGLDVILIHLDTARLITARIHLYKDAAERFLSSNTSKLIPELLDLLDSKTQAQYLWGAKGALAERAERLAKFDHLLSLLSEKVELVGGLMCE